MSQQIDDSFLSTTNLDFLDRSATQDIAKKQAKIQKLKELRRAKAPVKLHTDEEIQKTLESLHIPAEDSKQPDENAPEVDTSVPLPVPLDHDSAMKSLQKDIDKSENGRQEIEKQQQAIDDLMNLSKQLDS